MDASPIVQSGASWRPESAGRGSDYAPLSRQVRQAGLLDRRPRYYAWKITLTAAALAAGWAAFAVIGNSWWQLAVAVFLAVVFTQLGFLGHDAGHRQIFAHPAGQLRPRHPVRQPRHRAQLRLVGRQAQPASRPPQHRGRRPRHHDQRAGVLRRQGTGRAGASSGWPSATRPTCSSRMLFLEAVSLHAASIRAVTGRAARHRAWEAALLGVHFAAYLAAVFLVLSPVKAVVFILVQQGLFGFYLGCSFAPNHKGMPILAAVRQDRLPAPPGADLAQRPRRLAHRLRARRPELPDRAPPVPVHATAEPAPGPAAGRRVLRRARPAVLRGQPARAPTPRRCATSTPSAGSPGRQRVTAAARGARPALT